jgi:hypothetical protein
MSNELLEDLARFDGWEVAALCGCLQLLPENSQHGDRLIALAGAALRTRGDGTQSPTRDDLVRWLIDGPSLHTGPPWDEYEGPFAEPVTFTGGGYLVMTGGDPESVFNLQTLLNAIFGLRQPLARTEFNRRSLALALGALRLSTAVCQIAGIERWESAAGSGDSVVVPAADDLERLRQGVVFSHESLGQLLRADPEDLAAITRDADDAIPPPDGIGSEFQSRPLLRRGERYTLIEPPALGLGLRHALLAEAIHADLRPEVVGWLARAAISRVKEAADRMNWAVQSRLARDDGPIVSLVAAFDADKVANLLILYEDLDNYSDSDPVGSWEAQRWEDLVYRQMRDVEEEFFFGSGLRPNEILHVVVLAGVGRFSTFSLGEPAPPVRAPHLIVSLENFDRISMGANDQLRLWKYAQASDRVRDYARVLAFGPLDEFAAWNEHQSYYFGDEARPTFLVIDGTHGRAFRERVARETDVHSVKTPVNTWAEVVRLHRTQDIPIYGILRTLGGQPLLLVEGGAIPIWVRAPTSYAEPHLREPFLQMVDTIAYWIWQFTPSLPEIVADRIMIDVEIDHPEVWLENRVTDAPAPAVSSSAGPEGIIVEIHDALLSELDGPDNAGERELARALLTAIDQLADEDARLGHDGIAAAIESHAPLGPKKKVNLLDPAVEPSLVDGDLPPYRGISDADVDRLHEEVGIELANRLQPAPIPPDLREQVLNEVVAFHFSQLQKEAGQLSPDRLLQTLVALHETVVRREALQRRMLGSRMAAFGETGLIDDLRTSLPRATQAAVALRFLIEYLAARPPTGLRPFALDIYDRLLAVCVLIISRGMTSDAFHFGLEDSQLSYLGSGRLGLSRGRYQIGQEQYLDAVVPEHARALAARYPDSWRQDADVPPPELDEINVAAQAEWGKPLTLLLEFFGAVSELAYERGDGVAATVPSAELEALLAERLGWPIDELRDLAVHFTLTERPDFLRVPDGFERYEVWPWRFNRRLSYLSRPLLTRRVGSTEEYVFGVRHPHQTAKYMVSLITSERLRAQSTEMRNLMTRLRQRETQRFVEQVAEVHSQRGMSVRVNVKKIAGERITRENGDDLTDVDVLAADPRGKMLYALECKDLEAARTPVELQNELRNTFSSGGSRRSAADKQVERVAWLRQRLRAVLKDLGINDSPADWRVQGAIVTDVHVMSAYVAECPLPVIAWADLRDAPGD